VTLFATSVEGSPENNNRLIRYVDTGATSNPTGVVLAAAGTNRVFRGVTLSPHR
jgi:hypothetical protein